MTAAAGHGDGVFNLNQDLDEMLTEYFNIVNNIRLLVLITTRYATGHDAEQRMLLHRHLPRIGFKSPERLPKVAADTLRMIGKCDCKRCNTYKSARKPITPLTSCATRPLQLVHSDIYGPWETAIRGGRTILILIDTATRHLDEHRFKSQSQALEKSIEWKSLGERESAKQGKRFRTDGGGE